MGEEVQISEYEIHQAIDNISLEFLKSHKIPFSISKIIDLSEKGSSKFTIEFSINQKGREEKNIDIPDNIKLINYIDNKSRHDLKDIKIKTTIRESNFPLNFIKNNTICSKTENTRIKNRLIGGGGLLLGKGKSTTHTIGAFLKNKISNDFFALTVSHGIIGNENLYYFDGFFDNNNRRITNSIGGFKKINRHIDYALIDIDNNINHKINSGIKISGTIPHLYSDNMQGEKVKKYGFFSDFTEGIIHSNYCNESINGQTINKGLIEVKHQSSSCLFTVDGDSGSLVIDNNNRIVGIVKSRSRRSEKFSKIIPIKQIMDDINLNLTFNF
ncbi:hypothetical protein [uncultured Tenacibaculum sp.]|uniref:hypothetical protein n=1 Tax=uncultured Tenacibaculum sp. TaxID=174713 RepID=UPI002612A8F0|nr:hypothetical protein [uncultured Tenacibaculum sp.]